MSNHGFVMVKDKNGNQTPMEYNSEFDQHVIAFHLLEKGQSYDVVPESEFDEYFSKVENHA